MGKHRMQRRNHKTTNTYHTKVVPLLGVNWLKQLLVTINKIFLDEHTNQSNEMNTKFHKLFETNHTIKNAEVKIQMKTGMLSHTTKSQTITISPPERCKERTRPPNKIRTPRKTRNNRRRLFRITRSNYGKERQASRNRTRCTQNKR